MHLAPLIEREWHFWQRRPWWQRPPYLLLFVYGGVALFLAPMEFFTVSGADPQDLLGFSYCFALGAHFFSGGGVMSVMAGEIQAGSLPLLLLTGLRIRDLVVGQFVCGLTVALWAALGLGPWLIAGWLNSNMSAGDLAWVGLCWLLCGIALNALMVAAASCGRTLAPGTMVVLGPLVVFSSLLWILPFLTEVPMTRAAHQKMETLCEIFGCVTLAALGIGGWQLRGAQRADTGADAGPGGNRTPRRPGPVQRKRLLERNPIEWLGAAPSPRWAWGILVLGFVAGSLLGGATGEDAFAVACWTRGVLLVFLAMDAFVQIRVDLRDGTWEPLLRTPITVRQYIQGHWRAWWRQQRLFLLVLVLAPAVVEAFSEVGAGMAKRIGALIASGAVLTLSDAGFAGIFFLGAAVKRKGHEFYLAGLLTAGIVLIMQRLHTWTGPYSWWPWTWGALAALIVTKGRASVHYEIRVHLAEAAGDRHPILSGAAAFRIAGADPAS